MTHGVDLALGASLLLLASCGTRLDAERAAQLLDAAAPVTVTCETEVEVKDGNLSRYRGSPLRKLDLPARDEWNACSSVLVNNDYITAWCESTEPSTDRIVELCGAVRVRPVKGKSAIVSGRLTLVCGELQRTPLAVTQRGESAQILASQTMVRDDPIASLVGQCIREPAIEPTIRLSATLVHGSWVLD